MDRASEEELDRNPTPDISNPLVRREYSLSAMAGFVAIIRAWAVRDEDATELIGGIPPGSYEAINSGKYAETLSEDQLTRISYLIGIYKALHILLPKDIADTWMSRPNDNPVFGGIAPLAFCLKEGLPGLAQVRRLLDGEVQSH